jgi:hypothetical protein
MPLAHPIEKRFPAGDAVRDIVIGLSDRLTVAFAPLRSGKLAPHLARHTFIPARRPADANQLH